MASIYELKGYFQQLLRPLSNALAKNHYTANSVTLFAFFASFLMGMLIMLRPTLHWPFLLLTPFLFFRMALNAIDGILAKEHHMKTALGVFLNELGDVFSEIFLYLPFAFVQGISPSLVVAVLTLSIISEMAGIIAVQIGGQRRYEGPMGKSDRALVFGGISLLLGFGMPSKIWCDFMLGIMILLLLLTIYNRTTAALQEANE